MPAKLAATREHYDAAQEGHIYVYSQSPHRAIQNERIPMIERCCAAHFRTETSAGIPNTCACLRSDTTMFWQAFWNGRFSLLAEFEKYPSRGFRTQSGDKHTSDR